MSNLDPKLTGQMKSIEDAINLLSKKDNIKVSIGKLGGRTYTIGEGKDAISFKMKDLVGHMKELIQKEKTISPDQKTSLMESLDKIQDKGEKAHTKTNALVQLLTKIRSYLGGRGASALESLRQQKHPSSEQKPTGAPKTATPPRGPAEPPKQPSVTPSGTPATGPQSTESKPPESKPPEAKTTPEKPPVTIPTGTPSEAKTTPSAPPVGTTVPGTTAQSPNQPIGTPTGTPAEEIPPPPPKEKKLTHEELKQKKVELEERRKQLEKEKEAHETPSIATPSTAVRKEKEKEEDLLDELLKKMESDVGTESKTETALTEEELTAREKDYGESKKWQTSGKPAKPAEPEKEEVPPPTEEKERAKKRAALEERRKNIEERKQAVQRQTEMQQRMKDLEEALQKKPQQQETQSIAELVKPLEERGVVTPEDKRGAEEFLKTLEEKKPSLKNEPLKQRVTSEAKYQVGKDMKSRPQGEIEKENIKTLKGTTFYNTNENTIKRIFFNPDEITKLLAAKYAARNLEEDPDGINFKKNVEGKLSEISQRIGNFKLTIPPLISQQFLTDLVSEKPLTNYVFGKGEETAYMGFRKQEVRVVQYNPTETKPGDLMTF